MKTTRITGLAIAAALAVPTLFTVAAKASTLPTVVVMHRNIQNMQDEQNWQALAQGLSYQGYRVISVAMDRNETAATAADHTIKLLDETGCNDKLVLVGTAAASDAISAVAQAEPSKVKALVYVSNTESVPTFGPRSVSEPVALNGIVRSFQVKVTNAKSASLTTEGGSTMFMIREQGHSTLGRTSDMVAAIDRVHQMVAKG